MSGVTIDHPVRGWNPIAHQPRSYAWWDGQRFTKFAYREDDHWECLAEDVTERSELPAFAEPDGRASRIIGVVGLLISFVAALAVLSLLLVSLLSRSDGESRLTDRVNDVHADLEAAGFKCSGLDVTESDVPFAVPSLVYAEGRCELTPSQSVDIRVFRSQQDVNAAVHALRSENSSYIIGNHWYVEMYPADVRLAQKIAAALNTRVVAGTSQSIVALARQ